MEEGCNIMYVGFIEQYDLIMMIGKGDDELSPLVSVGWG